MIKYWLIQHYLTLIRLVSMMQINANAMPTNNTDNNFPLHYPTRDLLRRLGLLKGITIFTIVHVNDLNAENPSPAGDYHIKAVELV